MGIDRQRAKEREPGRERGPEKKIGRITKKGKLAETNSLACEQRLHLALLVDFVFAFDCESNHVIHPASRYRKPWVRETFIWTLSQRDGLTAGELAASAPPGESRTLRR